LSVTFMKYIMVFKSRMIGKSYSRYDRDFIRQTSKRKKEVFGGNKCRWEKSLFMKTNYLTYLNLFLTFNCTK